MSERLIDPLPDEPDPAGARHDLSGLEVARARTIARLPLNALRAFSAAARTGGMAAAANELGLTPGAVSQQVKTLEDRLGLKLFDRSARAVRLTPVGADLAEAAQQALDRLAHAYERALARTAPDMLTVGVPPSFASLWLAPRIGGFLKARPDVAVRLDSQRHHVDLARGEADIALRWGRGAWRGLVVVPLGRQRLMPVAAPDVAARLHARPDLAPADLLDETRLHFAELDDWGCWLRAACVPTTCVPATAMDARPVAGPVFSESTAVIEAAEAGQGIAIGRPFLVADAVAAGRLVPLFPAIEADDGWGYYLVATETALRRPVVAAFRDWLLAEVARTPEMARTPTATGAA